MSDAESAQLCFGQIARTVVIVIHDEHRTAISEPPTEPHRRGNGPPTKCRRMHTFSGALRPLPVVQASRTNTLALSIALHARALAFAVGNCPVADPEVGTQRLASLACRIKARADGKPLLANEITNLVVELSDQADAMERSEGRSERE
jgi:hypothetical protein